MNIRDGQLVCDENNNKKKKDRSIDDAVRISVVSSFRVFCFFWS